MNPDLLNSLAELCYLKGVRHAVLCPGSRSAPLILAFTNNKKIKCRTFSDERSAAFIALGMARQTGAPVVLVCTSGSAAYNFSPAVAEAYFQHIPLLVFTADRPQEWIDQYDGQTIRQSNLYGKHVMESYELPVDTSHPDAQWHANRIINEAINLSQTSPGGPVHVNAPFREPLYLTAKDEVPTAPRVIQRIPQATTLTDQDWTSMINNLQSFKKILVVAGQLDPGAFLPEQLKALQAKVQWPVAGDILSNLHGLSAFNSHCDTFLGQVPENSKDELKPDLLITFGKSLIAKNLKIFLRKNKPKEHWHLQSSGAVADTFQSLTKIIPVGAAAFFEQVTKNLSPQNSWSQYSKVWAGHEQKSIKTVGEFLNAKEGEFSYLKKIIDALPSPSNLHLANSMSVRYANHIGLTASQKGINVFSNRGTSGIDGCTSSSVGHALTSDIPNVLVTGDLAFLYDRNAFWHNYPLPNLFVLVLNNHGGIIFNLIDGPSGLPQADEFFITNQRLRAEPLAREFGFQYFEGSTTIPADFFSPGTTAKILEFESTQSLNKKIFESFRNQIKKSYES